MARIVLFIWMITLSLSLSLSAKIIATSDLEDIAEHFEKLDAQSLLMWDVDTTLIFPTDKVLHPKNEEIMRELFQHYMGKKSNKEWKKIMSQVWSRTPYGLVDPRAPKLILSLQKEGIPTIAFTAMRTGNFGVIPSMENWRIHQLQEVGIDFSTCFFSHVDLQWNETFPQTGSPAFKKGVLCSDRLDKGPVLATFFQKIDWKPTYVLFIDDTLACLTSVEEALNHLNIPFIGIHYRAAEHLEPSLDLAVAHHQYQVLAEKGIWLTDQEALISLQQTLFDVP